MPYPQYCLPSFSLPHMISVINGRTGALWRITMGAVAAVAVLFVLSIIIRFAWAKGREREDASRYAMAWQRVFLAWAATGRHDAVNRLPTSAHSPVYARPHMHVRSHKATPPLP